MFGRCLTWIEHFCGDKLGYTITNTDPLPLFTSKNAN